MPLTFHCSWFLLLMLRQLGRRGTLLCCRRRRSCPTIAETVGWRRCSLWCCGRIAATSGGRCHGGGAVGRGFAPLGLHGLHFDPGLHLDSRLGLDPRFLLHVHGGLVTVVAGLLREWLLLHLYGWVRSVHGLRLDLFLHRSWLAVGQLLTRHLWLSRKSNKTFTPNILIFLDNLSISEQTIDRALTIHTEL